MSIPVYQRKKLWAQEISVPSLFILPLVLTSGSKINQVSSDSWFISICSVQVFSRLVCSCTWEGFFPFFLVIQNHLILKIALFFQCLVSHQAEKLLLVLSLNAPSFSFQDWTLPGTWKLSTQLCVTSHPSAAVCSCMAAIFKTPGVSNHCLLGIICSLAG